MKQISEIHIEQYRGLVNVELRNIQGVNLLVGGNNSGKTSVLEAIGLLCRPLDLREWVNTARRREIMLPNVPFIDLLRWFFPQGETDISKLFKGKTLIHADGHFPVRTIQAEFEEIRSQNIINTEDEFQDNLTETTRRGARLTLSASLTPDAVTLYGASILSETFELWEDENLIRSEDLNMPALPVKTIAPHAHRVERLQIQQFSEAGLRELTMSILPLLNAFDPNIQSLELWAPSVNRPTLYIRHSKLGLAPLSSFGDGMRRVILLATTIPLCRNGILLIDELETAIHTKMLVHTLNWLVWACAQNNVQLFASTHSLEAVDAVLAAEGTRDDLVMYRLQSDKHGSSTIRLDKEVLTDLREELGQEVRW